MRNRKLLLKVADVIEKNADHFDMGSWGYHGACGTTACIAGWTVLTVFRGARFHRRIDSIAYVDEKYADAIDALEIGGCDDLVDHVHGKISIDVGSAAYRILGLHEGEFRLVFNWEGWPERFRQLAEDTNAAKAAAAYLRWLAEEESAREEDAEHSTEELVPA